MLVKTMGIIVLRRFQSSLCLLPERGHFSIKTVLDSHKISSLVRKFINVFFFFFNDDFFYRPPHYFYMPSHSLILENLVVPLRLSYIVLIGLSWLVCSPKKPYRLLT